MFLFNDQELPKMKNFVNFRSKCSADSCCCLLRSASDSSVSSHWFTTIFHYRGLGEISLQGLGESESEMSRVCSISTVDYVLFNTIVWWWLLIPCYWSGNWSVQMAKWGRMKVDMNIFLYTLQLNERVGRMDAALKLTYHYVTWLKRWLWNNLFFLM